jgi:hypothetical protein
VTSGDITRDSIEAGFPGWEAWQGIEGLWHARIRGATPPVMVHGEDLVDLRDQLIVHLRREEMGMEQRQL